MVELECPLTIDERMRTCATILEFLKLTRKETGAFWNRPTDAIAKSDGSPVTELDRRLESAFRDFAAKQFPNHGVIGEEFGNTNLDAEFQWIIDPIDGTMNLVDRVPTFGTIISLAYQRKPILGFLDHPLMNICYYGGLGIGVYDIAGVKLAPFGAGAVPLQAVAVASATPNAYARLNAVPLLEGLVRELPQLRMYYDCFAHSMTISGGIAACIEYGLKIWDVAALMALAPARGGAVFEFGESWNGDPANRIAVVAGQARYARELFDLCGSLKTATLGAHSS